MTTAVHFCMWCASSPTSSPARCGSWVATRHSFSVPPSSSRQALHPRNLWRPRRYDGGIRPAPMWILRGTRLGQKAILQARSYGCCCVVQLTTASISGTPVQYYRTLHMLHIAIATCTYAAQIVNDNHHRHHDHHHHDHRSSSSLWERGYTFFFLFFFVF